MHRNRPRSSVGALVVLLLGVASCGSDSTSQPGSTSSGDGGTGGPSPASMCAPPDTPIVAAYDLGTGAYRWHQCGSGTLYTLAAATDDAVYVREIGGADDDITVFDASTGAQLAGMPFSGLAAALPDEAVLPMTAPPATPGVLLSGGQDDPLVAADPGTGAPLWSADDVLAYDDVWAVGDGAVFMRHVAATGSAAARAYELTTGEVRWETSMPAPSYPWWVADGRVFSIWTDLTVLSTQTGEVEWATDYGTRDFPGMRGVLANDDTVFVSFASGFGPGD